MASTEHIYLDNVNSEMDVDELSSHGNKQKSGIFILTWPILIIFILCFILCCLAVGFGVYFGTAVRQKPCDYDLTVPNWPRPYTGKMVPAPASALDRGEHTFNVPLRLYSLNRERLCKALKDENVQNRSVVLLEGGKETNRYNTDMSTLFRQESFFAWAFGVVEPGFYGAIDVDSCQAMLFMPELHWSYIIWLGKIHKPEHFKEIYGVDEVHYVKNITGTLESLKTSKLLVLHGKNTDSNTWFTPATFDGIEKFDVDNSTLYPIITELRVFKTNFEQDVLRYVAKMSSEGHKAMMKAMRPGMYEYQMESIFKHYTYFKGGMRYLSYTAIAASGPNTAVLHYGHAAEPNDRQMKDGDMVLFDLGAEYFCYGSDITTSYPVNGKFTDHQKLIYNAVLKANRAVHNQAKSGVSWVDMHKLSEEVILTELKAGGLLKGDVKEMMDVRLGYIFMPHGMGHQLGLDVHDVGGYPKDGPPRIQLPGLDKLRTARVLKAGMYLTIEPGCYFIDYLLDSAFKNETQAKFLIKEEIDKYRGFGGVRIEDDVLITENGTENFSELPRTVEEIEKFMDH